MTLLINVLCIAWNSHIIYISLAVIKSNVECMVKDCTSYMQAESFQHEEGSLIHMQLDTILDMT